MVSPIGAVRAGQVDVLVKNLGAGCRCSTVRIAFEKAVGDVIEVCLSERRGDAEARFGIVALPSLDAAVRARAGITMVRVSY